MAATKRPRRRKNAAERFAMRLDAKLRNELAALAATEGRTLSNYVRRVLETHIASTRPVARLAAV